MNTGKLRQESISRILVVVDPGGVVPTRPEQSALLRRASRVARATGASIELFYPCHDPSLELTLFANREEVSREKERVANRAATQLAELALGMTGEGLDVTHEVRWDHPVGDAILRKIDDSEPDLVMKRSRGPDFIVGLSQNTDWELIRNAPAHIWFVRDEDELTGTVLTAVGGTAVDEGIITESDYRVFRIGNLVADCLDVNNRPVHCYQVPRVDAYATYAPFIAGASNVVAQTQPWQDLAELHGEAISRFAEQFDLDAEQIILSRGEPGGALPKQAQAHNAGLLVMGARNLSRWERVFSPVAAEPVLAETPCDLLIVKEPEAVAVPQAERQPTTGEPDIDVEMAVVHPEKAFRTPLAVAQADHLTGELRQRILDVWELDIEAQLREEDEGGPVRSTRAGVLKEISAARREIDASLTRRAG
ncbi:MAG: universal stress protein [Xanthomonadales bacterium]